jgi:hypothetical protein
MRLDAEHVVFRPLHELRPHPADHDERRPIEPAHLQELPDHQRFERRPDAARHDHEGMGEKDEVMQSREKCPVLIGLSHEGVGLLLEIELDPNPDRLLASTGCQRALVGRLHQPGPEVTASNE